MQSRRYPSRDCRALFARRQSCLRPRQARSKDGCKRLLSTHDVEFVVDGYGRK